ncbi:zf-CCHC domain-containing protein [Cephalotus follicularis]|uniref:Zf-CCHC domain-containing protein n=1 Tax=Cephalotus follicularis TaxID=3775 RepID=A0A1Q3B5R8_CEPFO|nr:zf-CCHC domain-containing protein [Cephalotus follicularis]
MRCGATGHMMKNCTRDPPQQTANCGTPGQGSNAGTRACYHCGRKGHLQKDCWKKNGLCLRCGTPDHAVKDCPKSPPAGPMSICNTVIGHLQRGDKGKGIIRGTILLLLAPHLAIMMLTGVTFL